MEKIRNWKQDFYTIWAGQAVSLITSGVLQMAIIWHLTNTTGSAMVLSMATLVGFLPQAVLGSAIGVLDWCRCHHSLCWTGTYRNFPVSGTTCMDSNAHPLH